MHRHICLPAASTTMKSLTLNMRPKRSKNPNNNKTTAESKYLPVCLCSKDIVQFLEMSKTCTAVSTKYN